jgi:hypothetical protein
MNWFNREPSIPTLTREAINLSDNLLALDEIGQLRSADTIAAIMHGIQTLGTMPAPTIEILWKMLVTVATKAVTGQDPDVMMREIQAGLAPKVKTMLGMQQS